METAHHFDVQRLEGVACGLNEEHASVDTVVHNVHAVNLVLGIEVSIETLLNVVDNGPPRLVVVDEITKARGIDDSKAEPDTGLLDVSADRLNRDGLGNDVQARALAVLGRVERGVEQCVDESRLAKARFT